jgi:hypothetical protein
MTKEVHSLDIRAVPELARLAGHVRESKRPLYLKEEGETVAVVMPVAHPKSPRRRSFTAEDDAAFLASAGAWKDADVDGFLRDNAESRRISTKPAPDL